MRMIYIVIVKASIKIVEIDDINCEDYKRLQIGFAAIEQSSTHFVKLTGSLL